MQVVHVNIPAFAVAVERRVDARLRGRPVALAASSAPRAPLVAVSAEAFAAGIRAGDRASEALKVEPRLRVVPQNPPLYERAQRKLWEVLERFTPVFEPARLGSFYLDMEGMESLFGKAPDAAGRIHRRIREVLGLEAALGVARNKLVSRIAAKVIRPQGLCDVFPGGESDFLAPLEVDYLPGVGERTQDRLLRELGVRRIRELGAVPRPVLLRVFGPRGLALQAQAAGVDETPVRLPQRSFALTGTANLPQESNDEAVLLAELWRLVEALGAELRRCGLVAARARLDGLYLDRRRARRGIALRPPSQLDFRIFQALAEAWPKFLERRVALKSFSLSLEELEPVFHQADFFDGLVENRRRSTGIEPAFQRTLDGAREERLLAALDRLRGKYGRAVVRTGRVLK